MDILWTTDLVATAVNVWTGMICGALLHKFWPNNKPEEKEDQS